MTELENYKEAMINYLEWAGKIEMLYLEEKKKNKRIKKVALKVMDVIREEAGMINCDYDKINDVINEFKEEK